MIKIMSQFDNYNNSKARTDRSEVEKIESIERGLQDIKEGRVHSHETVCRAYEKYL